MAEVVKANESGLRSLYGCHALKRNICRHCLGPALAAEVDSYTRRLNAWVRDIGKDAVATAEMLLRLSGEPGEETGREAVDIAALLVIARYANPAECQRFILCSPKEALPALEFQMPEDFPVVFRMGTRRSRLSDRFEALTEVTSDELAYKMAMLKMERWALYQLAWAECDDADLMDLYAAIVRQSDCESLTSG